MKEQKILSILNQITGIFLIVIIFTIPFPKHIQTLEAFSFLIIILILLAKLIVSNTIKKGVDKQENTLNGATRWKIRGTPIDLPILLFTFFIIISIFFSVDYRYSLHEFGKYWLRPVLLSYGIVNFAVNKKNISYIVWAVIISSLAPIILGIIQLFTKEGIRLKGLFGAPTEFGQYLDYIIPFILAIVLWNRGKILRILLSLILIAAFFCLTSTYARASWVSISIAIALLCFIKNKKFILIPIVLIPLFVIFSPDKIKDAVISITDRGHIYRVYLWENSIDQIKKEPIKGYGWGYKNFHNLYPSFVSPKLKSISWLDMYHAHNYPLEIAFETGILALIVFLWLWVTIMVLTWKSFAKLKRPFLKSIAGGVFSAFIACSIHWLVEVPDAKQLIMTLWTFIGIAMAIVNITEEKWQKKVL